MAANEVKLAPIRSMQDYLLETGRFGLPDYQNKEKWNNRIVNNLLYYQTNYFISASLIFLIVGYVRPYEMLVGGVLVVAAFSAAMYAASNRSSVREFRKNHPGAVIGGIVGVCTLLMYALGSILVFAFGIALPIFCTLLHASLRMRSIKNKISGKAEAVGFKTSPMGMILKAMDQDY